MVNSPSRLAGLVFTLGDLRFFEFTTSIPLPTHQCCRSQVLTGILTATTLLILILKLAGGYRGGNALGNRALW